LHAAAALSDPNNSLVAIGYCLDHGAKPDVTDEDGHTPLMLAAGAGNGGTAARLLDKGANPKAVAKDGSTLIHFAAQTKDVKLLDRLISAGLNVNAQDKSGRTPLHIAALNLQLDMIKALLKYGANPRIRDLHGRTALVDAAIQPRGDDYVLALALDKTLVNMADKKGFAPLHAVAAGNVKLDTIQILLNLGADPNAKAMRGDTPLSIALKSGKSDVAALLRKAGAKEPSAEVMRQPLPDVALNGKPKPGVFGQTAR
jgi:ankyrin repeat protein